MGFRSPQLPVRGTVSVVAAAVLTHVSSLVTHEVASLKKMSRAVVHRCTGLHAR